MATAARSLDLRGGGRTRRRRAVNRLAEAGATIAALAAVAVLALVVLSVAKRGVKQQS